MPAFDDAKELLNHAEAQLPKIRKAYERALNDQTISASLLVEIKNFCENVRSALDFTARGLFVKYGSSNRANPNIYFPYATADQDRQTFEKSRRTEACIPGLDASRPDLVQWFLEVQHFGSRAASWLPEFMQLTNENMHQRLTPQVRKESKELRITGGGASIGMGQGASISLGPGASISVGGAIIRGGQTFGVGRPPVVEGGKVETITWVSFHFDSTGKPVFPFLEAVLKGSKDIVAELATK